MLSDLVICTTANCTSTWLYNSNRILKHEIIRTPDDTRWWRLVRLVHAEIGRAHV